MPYADIDGVKLFYTEEGSGPPLLLVHGWTCDGGDWSYQAPTLAANHRVIVMDIRGHGRSEVTEGGYTLPRFADDAAALLRTLDATPAVIMGHSLGFAIAVTMAMRHPETVRALVDVDGAVGTNRGDRAPIEALVAAMREEPHATARAALFEGGSFYTPASPPNLAAWHIRRFLGTPPQVVANTFAGLALERDALLFQADGSPVLAALTVPVLGFRASPGAAAAQRAVLTHPLSKMVSFEGSGHWLHQERPAELNALLTAWLAKLPVTEDGQWISD